MILVVKTSRFCRTYLETKTKHFLENIFFTIYNCCKVRRAVATNVFAQEENCRCSIIEIKKHGVFALILGDHSSHNGIFFFSLIIVNHFLQIITNAIKYVD
jgi:hypothetical protein